MSAPNRAPRMTNAEHIEMYRRAFYDKLVAAHLDIVKIIEGGGEPEEKLANILSEAQCTIDYADPTCRNCGTYADRMWLCEECERRERAADRGGT